MPLGCDNEDLEIAMYGSKGRTIAVRFGRGRQEMTGGLSQRHKVRLVRRRVQIAQLAAGMREKTKEGCGRF